MSHALADQLLNAITTCTGRVGSFATISLDLDIGGANLAFTTADKPSSAHARVVQAQTRQWLHDTLSPVARSWAAQCPLLFARPEGQTYAAPQMLISTYTHNIHVLLTPSAKNTEPFSKFMLSARQEGKDPSLANMLRALPRFSGPFSPYMSAAPSLKGKPVFFMAGSHEDALCIDRAIAAPTTFWKGKHTPKVLPIIAQVYAPETAPSLPDLLAARIAAPA